jgi:hypothetical protein
MADAVPLGREPNARTTSVVLRKLEEAEFVRGTMDVEQLEGPGFWKPDPFSLRRLRAVAASYVLRRRRC